MKAELISTIVGAAACAAAGAAKGASCLLYTSDAADE